jgi:K+-sensing histidine kinase KdpD
MRQFILHDLRTSLASISGAISGLKDGNIARDNAPRHSLLGAADEQTDRLNCLAGNVGSPFITLAVVA